MCLTASRRSNELLQQKVADFRRGIVAEVQTLVAECLAECLPEIDRVLEECLVVPRLRLYLPAGTPAVVADAVRDSLRESLRRRAINIWEEDRRARLANAEYARRRSRMLHTTPIDQPVVTPAWEGQLPDLPTERRMILIDK